MTTHNSPIQAALINLNINTPFSELTEDEVNKQFRKLSITCHPDRQHGKSDAEKEQALKHFKQHSNSRDLLVEAIEKRGNPRGAHQQNDYAKTKEPNDTTQHHNQILSAILASVIDNRIAELQKTHRHPNEDMLVLASISNYLKHGNTDLNKLGPKQKSVLTKHTSKTKEFVSSVLKYFGFEPLKSSLTNDLNDTIKVYNKSVKKSSKPQQDPK